MRKFFLFFLLACSGAYGQNARIVKVDDFLKIINQSSSKIQVVNFWATWCGPCVKELPAFEKINAESGDVKVTLVSLDLDLDPDPAKVYKFIEKKQIKSDVLMINERDANSWIGKISEEWSGALPATLLINTKTGERKFVEKPLTETELKTLIDEIR